MGLVGISLKTPKGERVEIHVRPGCTVDEAVRALVEQHAYHASARLMFGSTILEGHRQVEEFPDGSLLIVGGGPSRRHRSPQAGNVRMTLHHGHPPSQDSVRVDTEHPPPPHHSHSQNHHHHHHNEVPPQQAPDSAPTHDGRAATSSPQRFVSPQPERILVKCVVPALGKAVDFDLPHGSTIADLITEAVASDTRLVGCKVAFRGKFIGPPEKQLHDVGIRSGDAVHIATGVYQDANILNLFRIDEDYQRLLQLAQRDDLTELQRKALYEELMRVLFRTDELQDLEGEWRAKRKELVKHITELQDSLKPSHH